MEDSVFTKIIKGELPWLFHDILVDYRGTLAPKAALVPAQVA